MKSGTLAKKIAKYTQQDGITETATPYINLFRASSPEKAQPVVYDPCIVIVGQGQKCGFLGDQKFIYDPDNYLVMSLPMPFVCEVSEASEAKPFLGLCVRIDAVDISQLLMDMDKVEHPQTNGDMVNGGFPEAAVASPMDKHISDIAHRIMDTLENPEDAKLLIPLYVKELMFRILQGEQGNALRAVAFQGGRYHHISKVLKYLQSNYLENSSIESLADMANMSPSSFHQHFKAVTSLSPVQYLKNIRLHQARSLILQGGVTASSAASSVGYASSSQFSREYKRFFFFFSISDLERLR